MTYNKNPLPVVDVVSVIHPGKGVKSLRKPVLTSSLYRVFKRG